MAVVVPKSLGQVLLLVKRSWFSKESLRNFLFNADGKFQAIELAQESLGGRNSLTSTTAAMTGTRTLLPPQWHCCESLWVLKMVVTSQALVRGKAFTGVAHDDPVLFESHR